MPEQNQSSESFFFGVMVMKDNKWAPHSKYDEKSFGSALIEAETLDKTPDFEAVKVLRIPSSGNADAQKEMWLSPHLKAKSAVRQAAQIRAGTKQTKQQLEAIHAQRKATSKNS